MYQTAGVANNYSNYDYSQGVKNKGEDGTRYYTEREKYLLLKDYRANQQWLKENYYSKFNEADLEDQKAMYIFENDYRESLKGQKTGKSYLSGSDYGNKKKKQEGWNWAWEGTNRVQKNSSYYDYNWETRDKKIKELNKEAGYEKYGPGVGNYGDIIEIRRHKGDKIVFEDAPRMERDEDIEWAINNGIIPNVDNPNWREEEDYRQTTATPTGSTMNNYLAGMFNPEHKYWDNNSLYLEDGSIDPHEMWQINNMLNRRREKGMFDSGYNPTKNEYRFGMEGQGADEQYTFPYGSQDTSAFGTYMEPNQYSNLLESGATVDQINTIDPVGGFVPPIDVDPRMMKLLQNSGGYGAVLGPSDTSLSGGGGVGIYTAYGGDIMNSKVMDISQADIDAMVKEGMIIQSPFKHEYKGKTHFANQGPPNRNFQYQYHWNPEYTYKKGGRRKLSLRRPRTF